MQIDPGKIQGIASAVADASDRLRSVGLAGLVSAQGDGAAWAALVAARSAWEPFIRRLTGAVGEFGTSLVASVDAYMASDEDSAQSLRGLR